jgi:hypothetical protein
VLTLSVYLGAKLRSLNVFRVGARQSAYRPRAAPKRPFAADANSAEVGQHRSLNSLRWLHRSGHSAQQPRRKRGRALLIP